MMLSPFKKNKVLFAVTLLASLLLSVISIGAAFVLQNILDAVTNNDWDLFRTMLWVVPFYIAAVAVFALLDGLCSKKLIMRTLRHMRQTLYNGILSRDTETFQSVNTADYISALTNDVKTVEEHGLMPILETFQQVFVFIMAAAALLYYSPIIAGLMLVSLIAMYIIPASLGKPISRRQGLLSKSFAMFTVGLKDRLSGYDVIRAFQLSDKARSDFAKQNEDVSAHKYAVDRLTVVSVSLSQMIGLGSQLLIMLVSGYLVLVGDITPGVLLALVQLGGSFVLPVTAIMQNIPRIMGTRPIMERIGELGMEQHSAFQGKEDPLFREAIRFENVSFGYKPDQKVLHGVNLTLEKNKKYATIGASGSGKSTLAKLLCANYGQYSGTITMDGKELRDLNIEKLLAQISLIHQNVYMFDETIKDNIDLHREYSHSEWQHALSTSGVDRFLNQMDNGLDTAVGENGVNLSGGQRQRVAVARALIQKKPILILDEGTSSVDNQTAYEIETALLGTPDITIITITHNLSPELLRQYDGILFVENGKITEAGTFDDLLNAQAGFAKFIQIKRREEE